MTAKKSPKSESPDGDLARVSGQLAARLRALGIALSGKESAEHLADIHEAVERFEEAVEARGGDLMVDEGVHGRATEPDDADFVLPARKTGQAVTEYLKQLAVATTRVRTHPTVD
jgi:hypothetical protein